MRAGTSGVGGGKCGGHQRRSLSGFWEPGWFSRVFVQDNFYRWQVMFTATESTALVEQKA